MDKHKTVEKLSQQASNFEDWMKTMMQLSVLSDLIHLYAMISNWELEKKPDFYVWAVLQGRSARIALKIAAMERA